MRASVRAACSGAAETKAAYRLLSHEAVGWNDILAPHLARSLRRMDSEPVVLCPQDTTELTLTANTSRGSASSYGSPSLPQLPLLPCRY